MKKRTAALLATLVILITGSAQKAAFGVCAGATLSNFKIEYDGENESLDSKAGLTVGAIANIAAGKNFVVQPGIFWTQKGTKDEESEGGSTYKISLTNNYVEIPVNFLYSSGGFFAGAGPSIAFAVSGKWKYELDGEKETESANFGNSDDDDMKGLDLGANILAGYSSPGGFLVMLNFNQGLNNLVPGEADGAKLKSHYFGIRLGYMLKGKKDK
ncbi:MAG: PorT family protein [Chitinophagaceae bacterium]|nr:PorT family protein [Chitinophagaceae bacterium]